MADKDFSKLRKFVEAAITNPRHPVYKMGLQHSPILQGYAVNVSLLQSMTAEQWFTDYPQNTAKLEEVMKLCEEEETAQAGVATAEAALLKRIEELEAKLAAKPAAEKKPEDPPAETSDETPEA